MIETFYIPSGNLDLIQIATRRILVDFGIESIEVIPSDTPHHRTRSRVEITFTNPECVTAYKLQWDPDSIAHAVMESMCRIVDGLYRP